MAGRFLRNRRHDRIVSGSEEMRMLDEIRTKRDEIYAIARKRKAEKLWVFGSCVCMKTHRDDDFKEVLNG